MGLHGYVNIATPILLAVMGILVPWFSASKQQRIGWTIGFVIVGAVAFYAGIREQQEAGVELLGGDQFCAVSFLYGPGMDPTAKFPLAVTNAGDLPLYDVGLAITRKDDFVQNGVVISVGTIHPHEILRRLDFSLPLGAYVIEIRTKAGGWFFESLALTETNGTFHQSYYIKRIGSDEKLMNVP
jgi:hypothetical protein